MELIQQKYLAGERALFQSSYLKIVDSTFADGESPLKESKHLKMHNNSFKWKYPLWYCDDVEIENSTFLETARSGLWYTKNINIKESIIEAPKTFRRSENISLENVDMPLAEESLWSCNQITLSNVTARGNYFAMNSQNIVIDNLHLTGNYAFDGVKNIEVHNSKLLSKDAFWNCETVTVHDSLIMGEYLGWNSKNLTFINCTIESLQGLCYIENLVLINCKLLNTTLAFEYSTVNAGIVSHIDSIKNPINGTIKAKSIGEIILDRSKIDPSQTTIILE